jgi:hypothetical protein
MHGPGSSIVPSSSISPPHPSLTSCISSHCIVSMALTLTLSLTAPLNQAVRTRTSEEFRSATKGIMFSSDVTARGLDYPDVTLVLQVRQREREGEGRGVVESVRWMRCRRTEALSQLLLLRLPATHTQYATPLHSMLFLRYLPALLTCVCPLPVASFTILYFVCSVCVSVV